MTRTPSLLPKHRIQTTPVSIMPNGGAGKILNVATFVKMVPLYHDNICTNTNIILVFTLELHFKIGGDQIPHSTRLVVSISNFCHTLATRFQLFATLELLLESIVRDGGEAKFEKVANNCKLTIDI